MYSQKEINREIKEHQKEINREIKDPLKKMKKKREIKEHQSWLQANFGPMDMPLDDIHTINIEDKIKAYCRESINTDEQQFSIYRVPSHIRKNNESYYEPMMVSIGPYHQGKDHLCAMQQHKRDYLRDFINKGKGKIEDYIQEIREMEPSIRACYFETFNLDKEKFVETMLLDSCFIIQLFIKWSFIEAHPTHSIGWALPFIMADLTMIENQIPFFVLEKMYNINCHGSSAAPDNLQDRPPCLTELLVKSLHMMHNGNKQTDPKMPEAGTNIKHLLDLYYFLFVPAPTRVPTDCNENGRNRRCSHGILQSINSRMCAGKPRPKKPRISLSECCTLNDCCTLRKRRDGELSPRMIPSAKELQEFGVTFKKKKYFNSFLDISFNNGVLEIPYIVVEKAMRSRFLNLVAFDQCRSTDQKHLTSYAVFLDFLINTSEDVIILQRCGIIENMLSDTTEAAQFFNQLGACAFMDFGNHYLRQVFIDITLYSQSYWPKQRARLHRDYFSNPWSIIAFCAASLVVCITVFNTIYFVVTTFF